MTESNEKGFSKLQTLFRRRQDPRFNQINPCFVTLGCEVTVAAPTDAGASTCTVASSPAAAAAATAPAPTSFATPAAPVADGTTVYGHGQGTVPPVYISSVGGATAVFQSTAPFVRGLSPIQDLLHARNIRCVVSALSLTRDEDMAGTGGTSHALGTSMGLKSTASTWGGSRSMQSLPDSEAPMHGDTASVDAAAAGPRAGNASLTSTSSWLSAARLRKLADANAAATATTTTSSPGLVASPASGSPAGVLAPSQPSVPPPAGPAIGSACLPLRKTASMGTLVDDDTGVRGGTSPPQHPTTNISTISSTPVKRTPTLAAALASPVQQYPPPVAANTPAVPEELATAASVLAREPLTLVPTPPEVIATWVSYCSSIRVFLPSCPDYDEGSGVVEQCLPNGGAVHLRPYPVYLRITVPELPVAGSQAHNGGGAYAGSGDSSSDSDTERFFPGLHELPQTNSKPKKNKFGRIPQADKTSPLPSASAADGAAAFGAVDDETDATLTELCRIVAVVQHHETSLAGELARLGLAPAPAPAAPPPASPASAKVAPLPWLTATGGLRTPTAAGGPKTPIKGPASAAPAAPAAPHTVHVPFYYIHVPVEDNHNTKLRSFLRKITKLMAVFCLKEAPSAGGPSASDTTGAARSSGPVMGAWARDAQAIRSASTTSSASHGKGQSLSARFKAAKQALQDAMFRNQQVLHHLQPTPPAAPTSTTTPVPVPAVTSTTLPVVSSVVSQRVGKEPPTTPLSVLVHCLQGISRSASIVVGFMMFYGHRYAPPSTPKPTVKTTSTCSPPAAIARGPTTVSLWEPITAGSSGSNPGSTTPANGGSTSDVATAAASPPISFRSALAALERARPFVNPNPLFRAELVKMDQSAPTTVGDA